MNTHTTADTTAALQAQAYQDQGKENAGRKDRIRAVAAPVRSASQPASRFQVIR
jgi:hypothetical protein